MRKEGTKTAKTEATIQLERQIWKETHKQGVFGCFEVTIGWFGKERVDYMTYDCKGVWRCYEIKVSKSDFRSKAHNTFIGHFNYYVMPKELYEQVKNEIPVEIGAYCGGWCAKRAKRLALAIDEQILKNSLIRSLSREVEKQIKSGIPYEIDRVTASKKEAERERDNYRRQYWDLRREVQEKYGTRWNKGEKGEG
jgi:hypothetical protein